MKNIYCLLFSVCLLGCQISGLGPAGSLSPRTPLENIALKAADRYAEVPESTWRDNGFRIANIPNGTKLIVIQVTGTGINPPIVKVLVLDSDGLAEGFLGSGFTGWKSIAIQIPTGTNRSIIAEARNNLGQATARGQLTNVSINSGGNYNHTLTLQAVPLNLPPQISSVSASPVSLAGAGHSTKLNCLASDPENASLTYTWSTVGGAFGSFTSSSSAQTYWKAPSPAAGSYTLRCSVSDGTHTIPKDFTITVATGSGNINGNGGLF